jgi:hypothetical protein
MNAEGDPPDDDIPEVRKLEHFVDDCKKLDDKAFRFKHGDGFLLHYGPLQALNRPARPQKTLVDVRETPVISGKPLLELQSDYLVFVVRATGRGPYPSMITVGRTRNNDIVVPDLSVSKFHAFFKEEGDRLLLQDAGSRNGTALDGKLVPTVKNGKAVEVREGQEVRFANVRLHFLRGAAFRELVRKTSK